MKIKLFTLTAFLGLFLCANAQINIQDRIKKENVVRGIIVQGGNETEGYLKKIIETRSNDGITYNAYDNFQSAISFISKNDFETAEKLNKKMYIKYDPKEIDGYIYIYENGDTLVYESVKYSDKSDISLRMIPKKRFLRVESKGKLSIYAYFTPPPTVMFGKDEIRQSYEDSSTPIIVYRQANDEKSPKMIEFVNVEKDLADCPEVVRKYKNGDYGVIGKLGIQSKFLRSVNKATDSENMKYAALMEYNSGICDENEEIVTPSDAAK